MGKPLTLDTTSLDDGLLMTVNGDVDFSCSSELRRGIQEQIAHHPARLVIDLDGVNYMDSSGVAALVEALRAQTQAKRKLVLCNLQQRVRGIFEIARLDSVFTITGDLDAAKQA
jgi:anti-sigma B factor antagonist